MNEVHQQRFDELVAAVAKVFRSDPEEIVGGRRTNAMVTARQIITHALHEAGYSFPEIADLFGRTSHSTFVMADHRCRAAMRGGDA